MEKWDLRIVAVILLFLIFSFPLNSFSFQSDHYLKGLEAKRSGAWLKALNLWEFCKRAFEKNGKSDPRIGIAYIETVTEQEKTFYYDKASDFYFWGFSGNNLEDFREIIIEEAERIRPLVPKEEMEKWKDLDLKDPAEICSLIKGFWKSRDLTITSPLNERLLEHWERIGYSRKTFNKNQNTPYGTDDRGTIFIKYGAPDQVTEGNFGLNSGEVQLWAMEIHQAALSNWDQFDGNPVQHIKNEVDEMNFMPDFEAWKYNGIDDEAPLIFMFGSIEGSSYGMRQSVEDFIPRRAFSKREIISLEYSSSDPNFKPRTIRVEVVPAGILQFAFYEQLLTFDETYARRYTELESSWRTALSERVPNGLNPNIVRSVHDRYSNEDKNDPNKVYGPQEKSGLDDIINEIRINTNQIRLLDDNNDPKMAILTFSFPDKSSEIDYQDYLAGKSVHAGSGVRHSLITLDKDWAEVERTAHIPMEGFDNTSVFMVDHRDSTRNYVIAAEIYNTEGVDPFTDLSLRERMKIGESIRLGKAVLENLPPLNPEYSRLEVSDLIIGIPVPDELNIPDYSFPVIPAENILINDNLHVYLEIYHLVLGPDSRARFSINYKIAPVKKGFSIREIFRRTKKDDIISQEQVLESLNSIAKEKVEFDISGLKSGEYVFMIDIKDTLRNQIRSRSGKFRIIE